MNSAEKIYLILFDKYGKQGWWPVFYGKNKKGREFEICVGAILTQNTAWKNVEKALKNLYDSRMLSSHALLNLSADKIAEKIRCSGYYNQKAKKLKIFAEFFVKEFDNLENSDVSEARNRLLEINGIGKETADSIILYALNKPIFVIDAYTKRVFSRLLGFEFWDYDEWQEYFHHGLSSIKNKAEMFNEYHALIVEHAKRFCRKKPLCEKCFLRESCLKKV